MNTFEKYLDWLRNNTTVANAGEWDEVTLPFLDRHNDHIQIYLKDSKDGNVLISDGGSTFSNLTMSGFSRTEKRAQILETIFKGFNTKLNEANHIWTEGNVESIGFKFQCFLQTVLSADNLGYFSEENVKSMFFEDVSAWLSQNEISYVAKQEFQGKSGYSVGFPFYLPETKKRRQSSVIQLINNPKMPVKPLLFEWIDTEVARSKSQCFTLVNDDHIQPSQKLFQAFEKYGVEPIAWSDRDKLLKRLAA